MSEYMSMASGLSCSVLLRTESEKKSELRIAGFTLQVAEEYFGGTLIRVDVRYRSRLESVGELASGYTLNHWLRGMESGALYAYRALDLPRRHLAVSDLDVRMCAEDMEMLAAATAHGVAKLANLNLPIAWDSNGWRLDITMIETKQPIDSPAKSPERRATA